MNEEQLNILDHYKHPRNFEKPNFDSTHSFKESNLTCGDEIEVKLIIKDDRVEDVSFSGEGCSLCIAGASMLTEQIFGKSIQELKSITNESILNMVGIDVTPAREKCILLGLDALKGALQ
ncbi:iron-sulfur cluster assembly scaffold protein [Candidatus Dojkabacteria bacterium]|uniref:Iron-sulfur cluster assembly scaffold protein n=1 Tax=Candidatus Dojkabacteria bacterium TaxID=2099670 RepID=A0A955L2B5_9BACT|nr:iron-sulfur cluster assembly scaffold protein [Candidatus Dojkabacteria bacterium]